MIQITDDTRARCWFLTLNNYTPEEVNSLTQYILKKNCKKYILAYEIAPTTGTPHIQGWIQFNSQIKFKTLHEKHPRTRWFVAKGDAKQNKTYCSKEGKVFFTKGLNVKIADNYLDLWIYHLSNHRSRGMSCGLKYVNFIVDTMEKNEITSKNVKEWEYYLNLKEDMYKCTFCKNELLEETQQ